jgi:hypothetical protein
MPTIGGNRPFHVIVTSPPGFAVSFEDVAGSLDRIDRLFIEPDGAFVWAGDAWQIDGTLYDRDGRLQYVELKGMLPSGDLDRLLDALGWPATPVVFELVREGKMLDEAAFRAWLLESGG